MAASHDSQGGPRLRLTCFNSSRVDGSTPPSSKSTRELSMTSAMMRW